MAVRESRIRSRKSLPMGGKSPVALNAAEAQGNSAGNSRTRFESALGSLYEAQAGLRLAVAWGYFSQAAANEALAAMNCLEVGFMGW